MENLASRMPDPAVDDLLRALRAARVDGDKFAAVAPDWFGERVFGGVVLAQLVHAAAQTVNGRSAHSLHASFLSALRPGPVDLAVERLRDGRTFATRQVVSSQGGRTAALATVSFHGADKGDEYQIPAPVDLPAPESLPRDDAAPPPLDARSIGPTERRSDGTYRSTRRTWVRTISRMPDDPLDHLAVAAFLSDLTGTSFRPFSLGQWGIHADASIDHAVWFHRPMRTDEWLYSDFHALVNGGGRSTVRGEFFDRSGRLCMSMAQELLIRPLA
jgi:acyl-CoA thioesterase-2